MKRIVIASVAAAALLTGGTAFAVAGGGNDGAQSTSTATQTTDAPAPTTTRASLSDVAHAALKAVPGTLDSIDREHGRWEADVLGKDGKWHEVTLDASNAKVIGQHIDRDTDAEDSAEARALRNADVSAIEAARKAASRGTVTSVEFDDDRTPAWEVETVKNHKERDLNVDAHSGKVTQAPADDHDGDDDHGDDD
ncbi:PepSY domain-containing protein [Streptomyces malaysiensis]|uniref:PepSY domain-containing protein n=1 Tax=Streptomyces malaysiensis subsp. samsunensis TaxID=459658 RepID=A0A9X2LZV4_STRMQ|nr:PepSY domain-containing protein [Streptomyces samsunensis]MCQ8832285.1 PepSY domain-containing protein [Streptomyces samsunensis]